MLITQRLLGTPNGLSLVGRGFLSSPLNLTRAQLAGVRSSAINGTNDGLTFYGADVPRFNGSAQRLLLEGQSTNGFWNPQLQGAVAGSPGTLPSRTAYGTFPTGVTASVVGVGVEGDMNYVDIRYQGTAASSNRCVYFLENGGTIIASVGQTWTASIYAKVVAGAWPGTTPLFQINEQDSGGTLVTQANLVTAAIASGSTPLAQARLRATHTLTGAATAAIRPALVTGILAIGTVVDVTFRVAVPQIELGAFASSPILPPVGTPGASTRGADLISSPLSALGVGNHQVVTEITISGGSSGVLIIPRPLSTLTGLRVFINGTEVFGFSLQDDPFDPGNSTWVVFGSLYPSGTLMVATIPVTSCTILWSGVIPSFVPGGVHTIACVDDGSVSNRFTMRVNQASGQLQAMRALAGASATANAGAVTAGTPFKGGITIDTLTGTAGVSLNGNTVAEVTGGSLLSLTQFRLGNIFDASTSMWGETSYLRLIPNKVSYTELQSLTGALP